MGDGNRSSDGPRKYTAPVRQFQPLYRQLPTRSPPVDARRPLRSR